MFPQRKFFFSQRCSRCFNTWPLFFFMYCAEKPEGAGKDEEVPQARGAGVPHGSDGHSDAARGAGEELSGRCGRLPENHWEASHAGLIWLRDSAGPGPTHSTCRGSAQSVHKAHISADFLLRPRRCCPDVTNLQFENEECYRFVVAGDKFQQKRPFSQLIVRE